MRGLLLVLYVLGCESEQPVQPWFPGSPSSDTTTAVPLDTGTAPGPFEGWDAARSSCEPIAVPRDPCVPQVAVSPAPPGTRPCASHLDCEDNEFCGHGYCRDNAKIVFVCAHEASFVGPVVFTAPDGEYTAKTPPDAGVDWLAPLPYQQRVLHGEHTKNECAPTWHACERWPAWAVPESTIFFPVIFSKDHLESMTRVIMPGFEEVRSKIDAGCWTIPLGDSPDEPASGESGYVVVSIHFQSGQGAGR